MKTFKKFLVEDKRTASEIAEVVYRFTSGLTYGGERVECHASVSKVKREGQDLQVGRFRFHGMLSYIEWDESKWGDFEKVVESDKSWRNIKIKEFQSLVSDISLLISSSCPLALSRGWPWQSFIISCKYFLFSASVDRSVLTVGKSNP